MPVTTPSPIDLDAEDFRRLGVRPYECRLAVIRRAAARSAQALAQQQIDSPSEQVGLQLSRVATSAYRLLDPRQRHDSSQRVHVGRILPIVLTVAEQTNFHNDAVNTSFEAPFHHDSTSDPEAIELLGSESSSPSDWTLDLKDDDPHDEGLLDQTLSRGVRDWMLWRYPWTLLTVAGLSIGTILGLATMRGRVTESTLQPQDSMAVSEPLPTHRLSSEQQIPVAPPAPRPTLPNPVAADPTTSVQPVAIVSPTDPQTPTASFPSPMLADSASRLPSEQDAPLARPVQATGPDDLASDGFLTDPFASLAATAGPDERPDADLDEPVRTEPDASPPLKSDVNPREPAVHSVPEAVKVRAARARLVSLVPELAHAVTPKDVATRIAAIEALEEGLSIGSTDYWAARMLVAELAWLVEDTSQVSARLKTLAENYHVPIGQPLSDSFIAACDAAAMPETHQHLLSHGLRLADQLLISKSFEQCRRLINAIEPSAEFLESESASSFLAQCSQAADQMDRLATSASRMMDDAGEIDIEKGDGKILGRYYCLMLRQWELGLPWLVEASDARIASAARRETELGDSASADDLITLSQRWMAAASRSSGRASDSMRLHAIDLMQRAASETSGLKKLEMERKTDEALELVPEFLRELTSAPTPTPKTVTLAKATANSKTGLHGRISIDGQDIGVQLDYELGVAFTQSVLDSIRRQLDVNLTPMSIQMVGEFQLDEPASVLVSIAQSDDLSQEIQVDGTPLEFDSGQYTVKVPLQRGMHQIRWVIDAERLTTRTYLRLEDWASNRPLGVVQPTPSPDLRTTLNVAMVRSDR